ncbi:MAG: PHP domain-containing protein [Clostridiales bacterium]|nr:PHP domain-containing protein [Clostridiales bacterium]
MAFWGDYHTHTTYSRKGDKLHAKGSVMQNAEAAAAVGLKELAITDHGFKHVYGVESEDAFYKLTEDCVKAERETGVKIYAGLEHNLDPRSGKSKDISPFIEYLPSVADKLQIVQGGYHALVGTPTVASNIRFWTRNVLFKFLPKKKIIEQNTIAYKRLIDEYPIDFIGHLNRGILADAVEVAKYAHERGVYIELNGRHKSLSENEIKEMVKAGVEFICNSDAHNPNDVGKMTLGEKYIQECGIPYELIANWERLPEFRSNNFKAARQSKNNGAVNNGD